MKGFQDKSSQNVSYPSEMNPPCIEKVSPVISTINRISEALFVLELVTDQVNECFSEVLTSYEEPGELCNSTATPASTSLLDDRLQTIESRINNSVRKLNHIRSKSTI